MPIDFPNSPVNGTTHIVGGIRWQYDGEKWNVIEGDAIQVVETQSNDYTLLTADAGKIIQMDKATAVTVTVNSSLDLAIGDRIDIVQKGAGQVTVASAAAPNAVTLTGNPGLKLRTQWSAASLVCVATDTYILVGDLANTYVAQDGYFAVNLSGAWNAGNPTTSTSGTSFTVPSTGLYLVTFAGGAYTTTAGVITLTAHLNGSSTAAATISHYFNNTFTHLDMTPAAVVITLNSGTNYVWIKQAGTGASSDGGDKVMFSGIKVGV